MKHKFALALLLGCSMRAIASAGEHQVHLNQDAVHFGQHLIAQNRFVADKNGAWAEHHPSPAAENDFIRVHGIAEYAKWHLGIDYRHGEHSKARYKFPFGDFQNAHRSALIAIRSRARQFGYAEIERAAAELQRALEHKENTPH